MNTNAPTSDEEQVRATWIAWIDALLYAAPGSIFGTFALYLVCLHVYAWPMMAGYLQALIGPK